MLSVFSIIIAPGVSEMKRKKKLHVWWPVSIGYSSYSSKSVNLNLTKEMASKPIYIAGNKEKEYGGWRQGKPLNAENPVLLYAFSFALFILTTTAFLCYSSHYCFFFPHLHPSPVYPPSPLSPLFRRSTSLAKFIICLYQAPGQTKERPTQSTLPSILDFPSTS